MRASSMWCKTQRTPWPTHAGRCWWTRKPPAACWPACPRRRPLPAWRRCTRRATPLPAPLAGYRPCQPEKRRWWWPCNAMFSIAARAYSIRARGIFCAFLWTMAGAESWAQTPEPPLLQPFAGAPEGAPPAPWRVVGLPGNKVPLLAPDITPLDGQSVLRLRSDKSYGTVSHAVPPGAGARFLQWRWRLDQPLAATNLRRKDGDDAALKVCALFALPLEKIPFVERNLLRLARRVSGEALPGATLCYVWDTTLPTGTLLANAYTGRVRLHILADRKS